VHPAAQAFYMPWEELPRWSQVHLAEYGKGKILLLIGEGGGADGLWGAPGLLLGRLPQVCTRSAYALSPNPHVTPPNTPFPPNAPSFNPPPPIPPPPPECMADAYGVKRSQRTALIDKLNAELDEFA